MLVDRESRHLAQHGIDQTAGALRGEPDGLADGRVRRYSGVRQLISAQPQHRSGHRIGRRGEESIDERSRTRGASGSCRRRVRSRTCDRARRVAIAAAPGRARGWRRRPRPRSAGAPRAPPAARSACAPPTVSAAVPTNLGDPVASRRRRTVPSDRAGRRCATRRTSSPVGLRAGRASARCDRRRGRRRGSSAASTGTSSTLRRLG